MSTRRAATSLSVIASEARQSRKPESKDWIASSLALLAMTEKPYARPRFFRAMMLNTSTASENAMAK
jgi:hypothetical protein